MRPLVSYDDIASQAPAHEPGPSTNTGSSGSPPKKRRKNNRNGQRQGNNRNQYHNGDFEKEYRSPSKPPNTRRDYGLKEESRQLTQEEVWDDSALIHAWDAAVEEYEVLNGLEKKWKAEPVTKSALWYNIPEQEEPSGSSSHGPSFLMPAIPATFASQIQDQEQESQPPDPDNSRPVDFNTFIPHHDASLSHANGTGGELAKANTGAFYPSNPGVVPSPPTGVAGHVTKDEAFQQAMGAWYWAGYWTGVYHNASSTAAPNVTHVNDEGENEHGSAEATTIEIEQKHAVATGQSRREKAQVEEEDLIPT